MESFSSSPAHEQQRERDPDQHIFNSLVYLGEGTNLAMSGSPPFVWGAATSAYQVEGAVNEDGRGKSIWDSFAHSEGLVKFGHSGDVAVTGTR